MNYSVAVSVSTIAEKLFSLDAVYALTGVALFVFAAMTWSDRGNPQRKMSALFWFILGVVFAFGSALPHWFTGLLILAMVALDGAGRVTRGVYDEATKAEQAVA